MSQRRNEEMIGSSKNTEARYVNKIEAFLRKENQPFSERHIAERVFNYVSGKSDIPATKRDLEKLSHIRNALKILVKEKKIIESLIEDPVTKEQVMYYSITGWYATP
jgi:adenine-specific DNA methylase